MLTIPPPAATDDDIVLFQLFPFTLYSFVADRILLVLGCFAEQTQVCAVLRSLMNFILANLFSFVAVLSTYARTNVFAVICVHAMSAMDSVLRIICSSLPH